MTIRNILLGSLKGAFKRVGIFYTRTVRGNYIALVSPAKGKKQLVIFHTLPECLQWCLVQKQLYREV